MSSRCGTWGCRPERAAMGGKADKFYVEEEAHRYTQTGTRTPIQAELTERALQFACLSAKRDPRALMVIDVGCGSGLSGCVLTSHGFSEWIGLDISLPMLRLASTSRECLGRIVAANMGQGLPLRTAAFEAAVSISAVQWLCVDANPGASAHAFFSNLWRCLRPDAKAALQVYLENDTHANLLLTAAAANGFQAGLFVDFPHKTSAKKYFICLHRVPGNTAVGKPLSSHWCPLSWPSSGCCALGWVRYLIKGGHTTAENDTECSRLLQEHANVAKRVLRLLRRCVDGGPTPLDTDRAVLVEAWVGSSSLEFMPCGGPIGVHVCVPSSSVVQLAAGGGSFVGSKRSSSGQVRPGDPPTSPSIPYFIRNGIQELLAPKPDLLEDVRTAVVSSLDPQDWCQVLENIVADKRQSDYFWLELLNRNIPENSMRGSIAILHAQKFPQFLVLCPPAAVSIEGDLSDSQGGPALRSWLQSWCVEHNACVVGVDAVLEPSMQRMSCAWVLYVAGLANIAREQIVEWFERDSLI